MRIGAFCLVALVALNRVAKPVAAKVCTTPVWVNELHYDNDGQDVGEFIEIAGPAGTDLGGWQLVLYNGNDREPYDSGASTDLSGNTIPDLQNGFGVVKINYPMDGIQNGNPGGDGIALVDSDGNVVQFLSYEGSFTAKTIAEGGSGPAAGLTSTDIDVSEPANSIPAGQSLRLTGVGTCYEDFDWNDPATDSPGSINQGQTFAAQCTEVFINELHYDNVGEDEGEFIEIAGPAGTDLGGWQLVLYNGNPMGGTSRKPYNTKDLSAIIPDLQNGFGVVKINYPMNGIQKGDPGGDGIALVDSDGTVVQFLSYAGSFTAETAANGGGPAAGLTTTDIGVSEPENAIPAGQSLRLAGVGTCYEDFDWNDPATDSPGLVNQDQVLAQGCSCTQVYINEFHYDNDSADTGEFIEVAGRAGTDLTNWKLVLYNGSTQTQYDTIDLSGTIQDDENGFGVLSFDAPGLENGDPDGFALVNSSNDVVQFLSYEGSFIAVDGPASGKKSIDIQVSEPDNLVAGLSLRLSGAGGSCYEDFVWNRPDIATSGETNQGQTFRSPCSNVFINELRFNPLGTGVDDFVEVAGSAGKNLDGWSLALYDMSGSNYDTIYLSGKLLNQESGIGTRSFVIDNKDGKNLGGIALVDQCGEVRQFISFGASVPFTANDGPAKDVTSNDTGVSFSGALPGESLQLSGEGVCAEDFAWEGPDTSSAGCINKGQFEKKESGSSSSTSNSKKSKSKGSYRNLKKRGIRGS